MVLFDRVCTRYSFLLKEIVVKLPQSVKMAVDGLRAEPSSQQEVDILAYLPGPHLFKWYVQPQHELFEAMQIVLYGMRREVLSL